MPCLREVIICSLKSLAHVEFLVFFFDLCWKKVKLSLIDWTCWWSISIDAHSFHLIKRFAQQIRSACFSADENDALSTDYWRSHLSIDWCTIEYCRLSIIRRQEQCLMSNSGKLKKYLLMCCSLEFLPFNEKCDRSNCHSTSKHSERYVKVLLIRRLFAFKLIDRYDESFSHLLHISRQGILVVRRVSSYWTVSRGALNWRTFGKSSLSIWTKQVLFSLIWLTEKCSFVPLRWIEQCSQNGNCSFSIGNLK